MTKQGSGPASFHTLLLVAASLLITVFLIAGARSYRDLATVRSREIEVHRRIEATDRSIEEIESRIEDLRTDPATLERLAREELGLVKPGDVVILLPVESAESKEPPSSQIEEAGGSL